MAGHVGLQSSQDIWFLDSCRPTFRDTKRTCFVETRSLWGWPTIAEHFPQCTFSFACHPSRCQAEQVPFLSGMSQAHFSRLMQEPGRCNPKGWFVSLSEADPAKGCPQNGTPVCDCESMVYMFSHMLTVYMAKFGT